MTTEFDATKKQMVYLLDQIHNSDLALPDFQRDFVWAPQATRELVRSIIEGFPAGAILLMQGGDKIFEPRAFEGAPALSSAPTHMTLDGQQRLTSLYQAIFGVGQHLYFLNIQELIDGFELDDAVEVYSLKNAKRWESINAQAKNLMLPLSNSRNFADWKDKVIEARQKLNLDHSAEFKSKLNEMNDRYVKKIEQYEFPLVTLGPKTSPEAVCTIFETLNRTGVRLGVFDLLAARGFSKKVNLRRLWEVACEKNEILLRFDIDPYYILQVIAIWVSNDPRRGTVLAMRPVEDIEPHWEAAVQGMVSALQMLRTECGVVASKWIPYRTMLITLAATWPVVEGSKGAEIGARRAQLRQFFWVATFLQRYETQANNRAQADVTEVGAWLKAGPKPTWMSDAQFDSAQWESITPRNRALYSASMALLMSGGAKDFHNAQGLSPEYVENNQVDDHHLFPTGFLATEDIKPVDSILNRTLIDKITNIRISANSPAIYLQAIEDQIGAEALKSILDSHHLPSEKDGPLWQEDLDSFLRFRHQQLETLLAKETGWIFTPTGRI